MQMNPCPFCHEPNRLGVVVKQLRMGEPGYVHYGAYARCKKCKARGPLVKLDTKFDVRNERVGRDGRRTLIDLAVDAWNAVAAPPRNCDKYPTFNDAIRALADKRGWHDAKWDSERYCILASWLYAPATETEGGDK